jgi:hypothetical protein
MWWLLAATAWAANVEVAATAGALHPGVPAQVLVAVTDDGGAPADRPPRVDVAGGTQRYDGVVAPGIWSYLVLPPDQGEEVRFDVTALGVITTRLVPAEPLPESRLQVPRRVDGLAGAELISFRITGDDLPPPKAVRVAVGSGSVQGVEAVDGALEVTVSPGYSPYPRYVPMSVLDLRGDALPVWIGLRLRTRPRIALQTEPGTTLALTVGNRDYGPFEADEEGIVSGVLDQYPGEMVAQAVLTDDLGNETTTSLPLSSHTQPAMVALPTGPIVPGRPPPVVYLGAVHGDGHPWQGTTPACRTPAYGDLEVHRLAHGEWMLPLTELRIGLAQELRIHCNLGGAAESSFRVDMAEGLASRLRLRVWPEELSTDFPVAELQVILEDARGERMPVEGVIVEAERGEVQMEPTSGFVARGEYRGTAAVEAGEDIIRARYELPPGTGFVTRLLVGHGQVPASGEVQVHGRALDWEGRPLEGVDLSLSAGSGPAYATTGADGWATATVPLPDGNGPVVFEVRHPNHTRRTIALRGSDALAGPGVPELVASRMIPITAGVPTQMYITVDPTTLYTGRNSVAVVHVDVVDRTGTPIPDANIVISATEGTVGPVTPEGDGGYRAEYTPAAGDRPREVGLSARYESATASARLWLEPRPVGRAAGIGFGVVSNFGRITSPFLSVDLDWRTPWFGGSLVLRLGAGTYADVAEVDTGLGEDARIRLVLVPITVGLLGRREGGGRAWWLGIGGVLAPYRNDSWFGDDLATRGVGVLPPGLVLLGGLGQRVGGGEAIVELRAMTLSSPGGAATYQGPVGGFLGIVGYRIIY